MADATRRSTRFSMRSKQVGQLLLENGDVQADQVAKALKVQEQQGGMIGQVLRGLNFCNEAALAQALLKQVQVTDVQCAELVVPPEVAQLVPRETCEAEKLCPFERLGNLLCVVMGNPLNRRAITQIEERTHLKVKSFKSGWPKIQELVERTYNPDALAAAPAEQGEIAVAEMPNAAPPMQILEPEPVPAAEPAQDLQPAEPAAPVAEAAPEPKVEGIDNLSDASAVMVETTRRGLAKRAPRPAAAPMKPRAEKKAKINVDLDTLDLSQGEVIKDASVEEGLEEIASVPNRPLSRHAGAIVALKPIRDNYFYEQGKAPGKRTAELEALIESLPEAEVVAQSIGDYEEMLTAKPKPPEKPVLKMDVAAALVSAPTPAAMANRPIELQRAPAVAMSAVLISEGEFYKLAEGLAEDPIGEWDWKYAAAGPVPVQDYEES